MRLASKPGRSRKEIEEGAEGRDDEHEDEPEKFFEGVVFAGEAEADHLDPEDEAENEADDFEVAGVFKEVGKGEEFHSEGTSILKGGMRVKTRSPSATCPR